MTLVPYIVHSMYPIIHREEDPCRSSLIQIVVIQSWPWSGFLQRSLKASPLRAISTLMIWVFYWQASAGSLTCWWGAPVVCRVWRSSVNVDGELWCGWVMGNVSAHHLCSKMVPPMWHGRLLLCHQQSSPAGVQTGVSPKGCPVCVSVLGRWLFWVGPLKNSVFLLPQITLLCLSPLLLVSQFLSECVAGFELSWNVSEGSSSVFQLFQEPCDALLPVIPAGVPLLRGLSKAPSVYLHVLNAALRCSSSFFALVCCLVSSEESSVCVSSLLDRCIFLPSSHNGRLKPMLRVS